tara:strand:+ start:592 stop:762 length:171 start_codon:yes stop_codon:yes gene_type:complete
MKRIDRELRRCLKRIDIRKKTSCWSYQNYRKNMIKLFNDENLFSLGEDNEKGKRNY